MYRRDDFPFPPARGRRGVEFSPDGAFAELLIGRGDAPEASPAGRWTASGTLIRATHAGNVMAPAVAGEIVRLTPDRLEIKWE